MSGDVPRTVLRAASGGIPAGDSPGVRDPLSEGSGAFLSRVTEAVGGGASRGGAEQNAHSTFQPLKCASEYNRRRGRGKKLRVRVCAGSAGHLASLT